jgi:Na+/melibiose symporter-like transporter
MISDTVDKDAYYTGERKEGVFYGCATFLYKLSQSLAVLFVGVLLDIIGFKSELIQPNSVYIKLGMILPVGFLICFLFALLFTSKYTLDKEKVAMFQHKKL